MEKFCRKSCTNASLGLAIFPTEISVHKIASALHRATKSFCYGHRNINTPVLAQLYCCYEARETRFQSGYTLLSMVLTAQNLTFSMRVLGPRHSAYTDNLTYDRHTPIYISREISIEHPSVGLASLAQLLKCKFFLLRQITCRARPINV